MSAAYCRKHWRHMLRPYLLFCAETTTCCLSCSPHYRSRQNASRNYLVFSPEEIWTRLTQLSRVLQRPRLDSQVRPQHVSPVLPAVRCRHWLQEVGLENGCEVVSCSCLDALDDSRSTISYWQFNIYFNSTLNSCSWAKLRWIYSICFVSLLYKTEIWIEIYWDTSGLCFDNII